MNSTWLITSELANQRARKVPFTCVVYTDMGILTVLIVALETNWRYTGNRRIRDKCELFLCFIAYFPVMSIQPYLC